MDQWCGTTLPSYSSTLTFSCPQLPLAWMGRCCCPPPAPPPCHLPPCTAGDGGCTTKGSVTNGKECTSCEDLYTSYLLLLRVLHVAPTLYSYHHQEPIDRRRPVIISTLYSTTLWGTTWLLFPAHGICYTPPRLPPLPPSSVTQWLM